MADGFELVVAFPHLFGLTGLRGGLVGGRGYFLDGLEVLSVLLELEIHVPFLHVGRSVE